MGRISRHPYFHLILALAFLFTTVHAIGHTHHDGKIHEDCSQYLFLQQYSAETVVHDAAIITTFIREIHPLPLYHVFIYSYTTYGTLFANAPPVI